MCMKNCNHNRCFPELALRKILNPGNFNSLCLVQRYVLREGGLSTVVVEGG